MKWRFHPADEFAQFAGEWDALNGLAGALPFLDSRAIGAALAHFGGPQVGLLIARAGGAARAMVLVEKRGATRWQTWQPSQLPLSACLVHPASSLDALLGAALNALPGFALSLGVTQLDPLITPRPADGGALRTLDYIPTAWVTIDGAFEDYWAARGKNLKHNVKRQLARLAAANVASELDVLTAPGEMAGALAQYSALECASWKAGLGTALREDTAQGRFYRDLFERFAASGQARVYRLRFDDSVVAMDLCLISGPLMVILKTACDDSMQGLSPAVLMHREIFAHLFDEKKIRRVEFFGRVMEWHQRWTEESRTLYHLTRYRSPVLPAIAPLASRVRALARA